MRFIGLLVAAAALSGTASAHHGWADYDAGKQQKVTGTVAELKWEQPHAVLWVNKDGKRHEIWLSPLQRMMDRGLQKDALAVGKTITVDAQPHATNANEWKAQSITLDNRTVDLMR